jgi:uncharacterized membrane protein YdjX (TVP38/TMEM64 family)
MRWYRMTPASARFALLVALIIGLTVVAALLPLHKIQDAVQDLGAWGPPVGILIGAVLLASLVPRTAISIASGALFGAIGGGWVSYAAAILAAIATFAIGRWLGRDAVAAHAGDRLGRLDAWLASTGLISVIVVRLLPIAPYGLVGYAYGTTSVKRRNYLIGTAIGATPSAFSYAAVGAAVVRPGDTRFVTVVPAIVGFAVTGVAAFYWWRMRLRHRAVADSDEEGDRGETDTPDNVQSDGDAADVPPVGDAGAISAGDGTSGVSAGDGGGAVSTGDDRDAKANIDDAESHANGRGHRSAEG